MDDEIFGPGFDDDFLNQVPDYDDLDEETDAQFYLSTLNKPNDQRAEQDRQDEFAKENDVEAPMPAADAVRKRHFSSDQPLGQHPLDWFINSDFDSVNMKRKKLENTEIKRQALLDRIVSKKNQLNENHLILNASNRPSQASTYLQIRPTDGTQYYELTSPDCFDYGYVEVYPSEQFLRPKRVLPSNRRVIEPLPTTDSLSSNSDTLSTIPMIPDALQNNISGELWSEKYQPRSFLELLTENEHSTVVMAWLDLWEQHVFKRKKNYEVKLSDYYKSMMETEELKPHLPKKKLLFLYGSSGCSKSTLAKICALQCGYKPIFIDASEYPNGAKFKESVCEYIGNAKISFKPELNKPVCLIIENIDGASNEVIERLIKDFGSDKSLSKKKRNEISVRRPIMLISSNFFALSIRKLRQSCFAVHISALNKKRTIDRLEKICSLEGLEIKMQVLIDLYEQCNCDLRQCLNNLQYLCSLWWKEISFSKEFNVRIADFSMFDVLNTILTTNPHYDGNKLLPPKRRSQLISNMLSRRSDVDTLYHALFYNANIVGKLRTVQRLKICKLLSDDDLIGSFMRHSQHWTLLRYTNTAGILIHFSMANYNAKRLVYNLGFMKFNEKIRQCREIIGTCLEAIKPIHRLSPSGLQLDFLPALYSVIQPNCNLTATQLQFCDLEETQIIHRIVDVMSFYGLSYSISFDNFELDLRLQPAIENIVVYQALAKDRAVVTLNTNAKKFINHLLSRRHIEQDAIHQIEKLAVSQEKKSQGTTELLNEVERVPGLAFLRQGFQSTARDVVNITSTKLLYRQGNSQAIRIKVLNKNLFSFF